MRRTATLALFAVLIVPAPAWAVTNTADFFARIQMPAPAAKGVPAPLAFTMRQGVRSDPDGYLTDSTSGSTISFPREVVNNGALFPSCTIAQLDNHDDVPPACRDAIVGDGISTAYAGTPGTPIGGTVREDMSVTLVNGTPAGEQWLLYLRSNPGAPVFLRRVVPGTIVKAKNPYGFAVRFDIPTDLQANNGLSIALGFFALTIPNDLHPVQVKGATYDASFLSITSCDGAVPADDVVSFNSGGYPAGQVEKTVSMLCEIGSGFPYSGYPGYPQSQPGYPAYPPGLSPFPLLPSHPKGGNGKGPPPRISGPSQTRSVTVDRNGWFMLRGVTVACPASVGTPCWVYATARPAAGRRGATAAAVAASVKFKLRAGRSSAVMLRLRKAERMRLAHARRMRLAVRLTVRGVGGVKVNRTFVTTVKARPR